MSVAAKRSREEPRKVGLLQSKHHVQRCPMALRPARRRDNFPSTAPLRSPASTRDALTATRHAWGWTAVIRNGPIYVATSWIEASVPGAPWGTGTDSL